jgi:glycosyltransferase involved in cell wall biosynthesis
MASHPVTSTTLPDPTFVSIVMPVRNEAAHIQSSLEAIFAQDYPLTAMEVILADGLSDDDTRQIVSRFARQYPNLRLVDNPGRITAKALNLAIVQARGEIIIRVDGHCEIAPDYVRHCVEHIQQGGVDGVGGSVETIGKGWIGQCISVAMSTPFGVGGAAFRTQKERTLFVDTIPFPAYTRSAIAKAGPYDEEMVRNQDDEYNYRLRNLNARLLLAADVRSRYYSRSSLPSLWRQYLQYGFWKVRVFQKHPRQMRLRQFVPPTFVAGLSGAAALALFSPAGRFFLGLIAALYLLANLSASAWVAVRRGWRYFPWLPIIYAILHVSYGLGFLIGLARFANRWGDHRGEAPAWTDTWKLANPPVEPVGFENEKEIPTGELAGMIRPYAD